MNARKMEGTGTRLLRVSEVSDRLAIGRTSTYRLIETRELPVVRVGGSVRVSELELERFIARCQEDPS